MLSLPEIIAANKAGEAYQTIKEANAKAAQRARVAKSFANAAKPQTLGDWDASRAGKYSPRATRAPNENADGTLLQVVTDL